ncbi:MAG: hypothetical protein ABSB75_04795, partial [Candidatus Limnocylindrales bacterium]
SFPTTPRLELSRYRRTEPLVARSCSVCSRSDAGAINVLLDGRSARSVAAEFGLSEDAVQRHAKRHLTKQARPPSDTVNPGTASQPLDPHDPLDELVTALRTRALAGSDSATREYRLALAAQSDAKHAAPPRRDLATEPEWLALRTVMLRALEPFAEARAAIVVALGGLG